jgi:hypothetical protein
MKVRQIHKHIVESAILGWFIGLAYYNWFAFHPHSLSILSHLALVTVVMYIIAITVAAATTGIAALGTKMINGSVYGDAPLFTLALPGSTIAAFVASGCVLSAWGTF